MLMQNWLSKSVGSDGGQLHAWLAFIVIIMCYGGEYGRFSADICMDPQKKEFGCVHRTHSVMFITIVLILHTCHYSINSPLSHAVWHIKNVKEKKFCIFINDSLKSRTRACYCQLWEFPCGSLRLTVFAPAPPPAAANRGTRSLAPRWLQSPIIRRAHIAAHKVLIYLCLFQSKIKV